MIGLQQCFNPHPREAGDDVQGAVGEPPLVSIHTRVKRVTSLHVQFKRDVPVSIHTRVKRVTPVGRQDPLTIAFQSTPA